MSHQEIASCPSNFARFVCDYLQFSKLVSKQVYSAFVCKFIWLLIQIEISESEVRHSTIIRLSPLLGASAADDVINLSSLTTSMPHQEIELPFTFLSNSSVTVCSL